MPRTRSLAWSELKIGILSVSALALAIMLILAVGGQGGFAWERYALKTKFADVKGLKTGAIVRVAGVDVGKVTDLQFAGADVEVTFEVNEEMQQRITEQSRAMIGSLSLLGEPIIEVSTSSQGTPLKDGDFIPSTRTPGQIADVADNATQALAQTTEMLKEIRAGKGTVGKLFTDDQLYKEINEVVGSAQAVADHIRQGRGSLGMFVQDPGAYRELNGALVNLRETTRRINAGEGSLGRLLNDDAMAKSFTSAAGSLDEIAGGLKRGQGTAGKLLTDQQLFDRFNSLAGRIDTLTAGLEQGQGAAGQFLQNRALYENMNGAANELKSLIGDIRKDPKKYLNVRVSIF